MIGRQLRLPALTVIAAAILAVNGSGLAATQASAAACPNESIRSEQGPPASALPECRAYELVSPGQNPYLLSPENNIGGGKAASSGSSLAYNTVYPASGSNLNSGTWLSRRSDNGWTLTAAIPQVLPTNTKEGECTPAVAFSENLETQLLWAGGDLSLVPHLGKGECGLLSDEIIHGEPRGYANLYLRHDETPYTLVNTPPAGVIPGNATFQAGSSDLSRVLFSEDAKLTPEAPAGFNLFEWDGETVHLIGILPNGEPVSATLGAGTENWAKAAGSEGGVASSAGLAPVTHAVSADGEMVYFEANGNLYLRENAGQPPAVDQNCKTTTELSNACTLQVDLSLGKGESGGGIFMFASRDGKRVFFTSDHKLTASSGAQPGKPDLYEYDVETAELTDINNELVDHSSGVGLISNVRGISGGADDGSLLYFVARGVLTGSQQNARGEVAEGEEPNLYLMRNVAGQRTVTYIATLSPWELIGGLDREDWWEPRRSGDLRAEWSPSGRYLLFSSYRPLTGADNSAPNSNDCNHQKSCSELFLFDSAEGSLSCVSCGPNGMKPLGNTSLLEARLESVRFTRGPRYAPRAVLDSGQVFFQTPNALLPADTNGSAEDVYEYRDGELNLISSGTADGSSGFIDSSPDGRDVFFATSASLVRSDTDGGVPSVYDSRIEGGFSEPSPQSNPCTDEGSCRTPAPQPPTVAPSVTTAIGGSGNVIAKPKSKKCKKGFIRHGHRCVKKAKRKQHHHKKKHENQAHRQGGKH
jgi:hypothetical protein